MTPTSLFAILLALKGHTDPVYTVAVSPDGKTYATGSFDKTIKLWNAATGKELRTLGGPAGHTNLVLQIAFAPQEPLLASASSDNTVKFWDLKAEKPAETPLRNLQHPSLVNTLAFDPAGTRLATAGQDGIVRIWDVSKKESPAPKTINAHIPAPPLTPQPIYSVIWTADGKQLISAGNDHSIKIWDSESLKLVREIKPGSDRPLPTKEFVTAAPGLMGAASGFQLQQPPKPGHTDQVYALALSPDGKVLASGSADRTIRFWNPVTGEQIRTLQNPNLKAGAHPGFVQGLKFTPDGTKLVSVGGAPRLKGYLAVWNLADGKLLNGAEVPFGTIYSLAIAADGQALLGCGPKLRGATESEAVVVSIK
jgi:WD40 repeat protein